MSHFSPSPQAIEFLVKHIAFVERLEILVFLQRRDDTWWSVAGVGSELLPPVHTTGGHLESLGAENLLAVRIAHDVLYRFDPGTDERAKLVREIVSAYYSDREGVVRLLTTRSAASAHRFAEAFRFRKKPRDG